MLTQKLCFTGWKELWRSGPGCEKAKNRFRTDFEIICISWQYIHQLKSRPELTFLRQNVQVPICSAYYSLLFSFTDLFISLLWCVLLQLPPIDGNCLTNGARLSLLYPKNFEFIFELDSFIHFGVSCYEFWGLAYARWDTLDMTMWCLQVCWEGSKIAYFTLICLLFARRVFLYMEMPIYRFFPWPNNLAAFGLV